MEYLTIVFECSVVSGELDRENDEFAELAFYPEDQRPPTAMKYPEPIFIKEMESGLTFNRKQAPMTVKAIIFDLDETLTDRRAAMNTFIKRLIARYFPDSDEAAQNMIAKRFKEADHNGYRDKREVYEMLAEQLPWVNPRGRMNTCHFSEGNRQLYPADGSAGFRPARVEDLGLKLGIITNGTVQVQEGKIHQLGFANTSNLS